MTDVVLSYEPLIQNRLMDLAESAAFPLVEYVEGRMVIDPLKSGTVDSATAHPESSVFGPGRNRRALTLDRTQWIWVLELTFKGDVSVQQFERELRRSPPVILRDRSVGRDQQVTLLLLGSAYQPPPEGQPAGGMRAIFRFNAQLTPS